MDNKQAFIAYMEERQELWKKKKVIEGKMLDYKLNSFAIESSFRISKSYSSRYTSRRRSLN
ncbi:hypothetical protein Ami103574_10925 [Aminipila butyrica]|uniref:Uncharacterized protein n=1 Tax=Aminipila butyrica TaxID=433296 RepID=A0A858BWK1_9FIRM|nr:hypothetical protein [Aminipila butyrica]QIB69802.1 hypothetical protein Ami103574_10925 [Aminipila butyrica]